MQRHVLGSQKPNLPQGIWQNSFLDTQVGAQRGSIGEGAIGPFGGSACGMGG